MDRPNGCNHHWSVVLPRARLAVGLVLVGLLLVASDTAVGQTEPRFEIHLSADSVKVGERFSLSLVAATSGAADVIFPLPDAGPTEFGDLHVVRRSAARTRRPSSTRRVDSVAYEVATFAIGSARVPVLPIRLVEEGDTTIVGTSPKLVPVISVVGPEAKGLRTPARLATFPLPLWMWAVLVGAGLLIVGAVTYAWWRLRGEASESIEADGGDEDPYEAAVKELQQLGRRNPNDRVTGKAFYVELTQALRQYIARRVGVRALECTTSELVVALQRRRNVPETAAQRIEPVLERADFVKFAGARPDPEESREVLREARGVLDSIEAAQRRAERNEDRAAAAA